MHKNLVAKIRMIITMILWLATGIGLVVLFGASGKAKEKSVCKGINIRINGADKGQWFVNKKEVENTLTGNGERKIKGEELKSFNLASMERSLKRNVWIQHVQVFFDNNDVLQVQIREREPMARIFSVNGNSYYIDSSCQRLPLTNTSTVRLPVITGFPSDAKKLSRNDSALLRDAGRLAIAIQKNSFWMAQVEQINITEQREFELLPMMGDHTIEFGKAENISGKLDNLFLFYRQVLAKSDLDRYSVIKLQYMGQIVGVRNPLFSPVVDTTQSIRPGQLTTTHTVQVQKQEVISTDTGPKKPQIVQAESNPSLKTRNPNPVSKSTSYEKKPKRLPKALMKKTAGK